MSKLVECELCKKEFKQITVSHLLKSHNITMDRYRNLFPDSLLLCDSSAEKIKRHKIEYWEGNDEAKESIGKIFSAVRKGKSPWNKGLNKHTDERVATQASNMKGRTFTSEHIENISKSMTKKEKFSFCCDCGSPKGYTDRKRCSRCAQLKRAKEPGYVNSMKGKKISEEHKLKLWGGWKTSFTGPELKVKDSCPFLSYTGDGNFWITFKDKTYKNPDFVFLPPSGKKYAVEVFGDYWHRNDNVEDLITKYNEVGWECLVIWEKDVNRLNSEDLFSLVSEFVGELRRNIKFA